MLLAMAQLAQLSIEHFSGNAEVSPKTHKQVRQ
jgi:hypothetical protein